MEAFWKGILTGITISFLIGPIFFGLVDITISKGWRSGLAYIFGILISDIFFIYCIENIFGAIPFNQYKLYVGIIGSILLFIFGISMILSKASSRGINIETIKTITGAFLKGFSINILNPFVIIWWIGIFTGLAANNYSTNNKLLFYSATLSMVFIFDLIKMKFAYWAKHKLAIQKISYVRKIAGIAMIIFSIIMMIKSIL